MPEEAEEVLLADRLCTGDKPSTYITGMMIAHAIRTSNMAIIMVDVLGRVVLMPPESVKILQRPLIPDTDLDSFEEDKAIEIMDREGRSDEAIIKYLKNRKDTK